MLRYALYARKSDEDRNKTEKSIREQVAAWRHLAKERGYTIVREFQESQSAMKPGLRPLYTEMIELIRKNEIDAILCWNINRVVRNMEEGGQLAQLLIDGVLKEIRTPYVAHHPGDNIIPLVLEAATSTQFSLDLSQAVRRGMTGHVDRGGWNSKARQGYRNERDPINPKIGIVKPDGERFTLIRKGWDMMLTGAYTPTQVMDSLNNVWGFRIRQTAKLPARPLSRTVIYEIFADPFYAGYIHYKGQLLKGNHTAMVTEEEFNQVQQYIKRHIKQYAHEREFAFTGLMCCGYCGQQITAEYHTVGGRPYIFYRCSDSKRQCTKKGMSEGAVEQEIVQILTSITVDPLLCDFAYENIIRTLETKTSDQQAIYEQQHRALENVETQLSNLVSMWLQGLMTDEQQYRDTETKLQVEKAHLLHEVERCQQEFDLMRDNAKHSCNYLKYARDHFMVADIKKKREIAHALAVEYVLYGREKRVVIRLKPLLEEVVRYADSISTTNATSFEPLNSADLSTKTTNLSELVASGGGGGTVFELPRALYEQLRAEVFPAIRLA